MQNAVALERKATAIALARVAKAWVRYLPLNLTASAQSATAVEHRPTAIALASHAQEADGHMPLSLELRRGDSKRR